MNYVLLGSQTSPFARRVRMLLEEIPYEFKEINVFETEDGLHLNKITPLNQIPVLIDGDMKVWDSRQIFNYLNLTHRFENMSWEDENTLTAIDGAMNSAVNLLLMKRSGMKIDEPYMFVSRQKDRIESVLDYLKPYLQNRALKEWNFLTMSIYCFLDWALFRQIINIHSRPECQKFLDCYAEKTIVKSTQILKV